MPPWVADWWKPIASAPDDASRVLVYCDRATRVRIGHYVKERTQWFDGVEYIYPSHWMPLPPPPKP